MDTDAVKLGLQHMADDMVVAGEPVMIDKVVDRYRDVLRAARGLGLRWSSIARLIVHADDLHAGGSAVSAQHLRASYSRARRKAETAGSVAAEKQPRQHDTGCGNARAATPEAHLPPLAATPSADRKARPPPRHTRPKPTASSGLPANQADPSEAELAAARRRLS